MKYFGTDGIRDKAERFTPEFLSLIVKGLVDYAGDNIKVLIGGDTRESSEWILRDLEAALETFGVDYGNVEVLPTPAICHCFPKMGFGYAIDVTASHNPYTDNGIKIFENAKGHGEKLNEKGCKKIEKAIDEAKVIDLVSPSMRESLHEEAVDIYKEHLLEYVGDADFSGLTIGIDCANGATGVIAKEIFEELGAKILLINGNTAYGQVINRDCGSTHLEAVQKLVIENKLDFGVAFDGDGDRCLMIDEKSEVVDGDEIIAILTKYLDLPSVAITVMANQGLLNWLKESGKKVEITAVGDTNVYLAMRDNGIKIGGEQSGHVILPGEPTGDGILTALMVTKVVAESKKSLSELASIMTKYPQVIVNLDADDKQKANLKNDEAKKLLLDYDEKIKKENGRLLVRPSGTEKLIRITMWGEDQTKINDLAESLKKELEEIL